MFHRFILAPLLATIKNLRSKENFEITRRILLFLIIIILAGLLQATFLNYINVFNGRPNLFIISVLIASLFFKLRWAIFLSIFSGILKDALSQNSFGINTLLFPLWSFLLMRLSKEIPLDNNFIRAVSVFILVAINDIIAMVILLFLGTPVNWGVFLRIVSIDSLYTASVLPLVFKVVMPALYPYADKK